MTRRDFNNLVTPKLNCKYGAPMWRGNNTIITPKPKTTTRRVYLDSGGYDSGGAYWGLGNPLYVEYSKCGLYRRFFRK